MAIFSATPARVREALRRYIDRCALLPQLFRPGAGISYCNSGYMIAGRMVEVLRGRSWDHEIATRILLPLGLKHAATLPAALVGRDVAARSCKRSSNDFRPIVLPSNYGIPISAAPAGRDGHNVGCRSDYVRARASRAARRSGVFSVSRTVQQCRSAMPRFRCRCATLWDGGLGWFLAKWGRQSLIGHDGGTSGQASFLRIHPASGTIAVLLTNGGAAQDLMATIFDEAVAPLIGANLPPLPQASGNEPADLSRYAAPTAMSPDAPASQPMARALRGSIG